MLPRLDATASLPAKLEAGVAHYLLRRIPVTAPPLTYRLASVPLYTVPTFPCLLLDAADQSPAPDLPASAGTFLLRLRCTLYTPADCDQRRPLSHDLHLDHLHAALEDRSSLRAFLNYPSTGADTRPLSAFHLYDIHADGIDLDPQGNTLLETITFLCLAVGADLIPFTPAADVTPGVCDLYLRPGGVDQYYRPDGVSNYCRPNVTTYYIRSNGVDNIYRPDGSSRYVAP